MAGLSDLRANQRALDATFSALDTSGAAERAKLECRIAGLQDRVLATRAQDLDDLAVRLGAIRALVAGLGEPGLLLNLIDAALADVKHLKTGR